MIFRWRRGYQLHAFVDNVAATVHSQQMNVVACNRIGDHFEAIAFFGVILEHKLVNIRLMP